MRCVRPILVMPANSSSFWCSASRSAATDGSNRCTISSTAAMCMAVGKVSFDDCDMLTWSLGWTGVLEPMTPPASSMARLEMTSLAFMFVCVPLPVCQMRSGKWSSRAPLDTSAAACSIRPARRVVELAQVAVDRGRGSLQDPEAPDERLGHRLGADVEVVQRALGLRPPVAVGGDLDLPHAVAFDPGAGHERQLRTAAAA